jgi:hypothetical protein
MSHRIRCKALLSTVLVLAALTAAAIEPAPACAAAETQQVLTEAHGSVALMANLRNSPDSIGAIAKHLLNEALTANATGAASCPAGCAVTARGVVYTVTPIAFLEHARQRPECVDFERVTSAEPLRFPAREFSTLEELHKFMMAFTRGKGDDGKALYRACSSNCSPRYTFAISGAAASGFTLEPHVVCGLARDKDETRYRLATSLRTQCGPAAP